MIDGSNDTLLIKNGRPHAAYQAPGLEMGLAEHGYAGVISFCGVLGYRLFEMIVDIELHDCPGQVLGQPIVDFVGDGLPFVVAGLQQMPEA